MATVKEIKATARPRAGKGAARHERRAGKVPGVIYGDNKPPITIALDYSDLRQKIYAGRFLATVYDLELDGQARLPSLRDQPVEMLEAGLRREGRRLLGSPQDSDQPSHLRVATRVPRELAELWAAMCPAQVYEVGTAHEDGTVELEVSPSNCVQCCAITAKGGRLTPPEGGSGPEYSLT